MDRRTFLTGSALGGAALMTLGGQANAAEWTPLERANVKVVNDFIAARVALRNAHVTKDEWDRKMTEFAIDNVMFTVHAVGNFVPQARIPDGPGPYTKIEMKIGDTFAKGPVVMHERVDLMSLPNRPDSTGRFIGIYALKDGKIHEWLDLLVLIAGGVLTIVRRVRLRTLRVRPPASAKATASLAEA